jgi:hypothetical protein
MRRFLDNWPRIAFVYLPLCLLTLAIVLVVREHGQPDTDKAIRLVRESNSRKENFTVQQYLYSTVYHRQRLGEAIEIDGWQANSASPSANSITVTFTYSDSNGPHTPVWEANLKGSQTTPLNDEARELSWH